MDKIEKIQFDFEFDNLPTKHLIHLASLLPIHEYYLEIPEGKVLDVGYEFGALAMYYAAQGRDVHVFDKEPYYEKRLKERIANEDFRDKISFSLGTLPSAPLPDDKFAIISICQVLHFFEYPVAKEIVEGLTALLMPGGWIITQNHHYSHLYSNNPEILGPSSFYKHFFSEPEIEELFPEDIFDLKYIAVARSSQTKMGMEFREHMFRLAGINTPEKRQMLKDDFHDIPYHTDITSIHQKKII